MGMRFRLKKSYPIGGFPRQARIVLQALKEYGMIVSDNGSNWYLSGAPHPKWSNDQLHTLHRVPGSAFEVVDGTKLSPSRSIRPVRPRPDRIERLPEQYFTTLLARVLAAGPDVIDVGRGNPDVPPPPHVRRGARRVGARAARRSTATRRSPGCG